MSGPRRPNEFASPAAGTEGPQVSEVSSPAPGNGSRAAHNAFPIVGIGASAGGLEAFTELLQGLPADTGMAFLLVQHLDPKHKSLLSEILGRATAMPVREAGEGEKVE